MKPYPGHQHDRKSIRLKGYDYSREGLYFITICCQDRLPLFGKIENRVMILNDAGIMIEKWYWELENKYPDKKCWEMVVMPNHFHCILENKPTGNAHDDGRPDGIGPDDKNNENYGKTNQKNNSTIGDAVGWFKTMTTNEYMRGVKTLNWKRFHKRLWQRNYYEHIIRNEKSHQNIAQYIIDNPENWNEDKFY